MIISATGKLKLEFIIIGIAIKEAKPNAPIRKTFFKPNFSIVSIIRWLKRNSATNKSREAIMAIKLFLFDNHERFKQYGEISNFLKQFYLLFFTSFGIKNLFFCIKMPFS